MPVTCRATCGREDAVALGLVLVDDAVLLVLHLHHDVLPHPDALVGEDGVDAGQLVQAQVARAEVAGGIGRDVAW